VSTDYGPSPDASQTMADLATSHGVAEKARAPAPAGVHGLLSYVELPPPHELEEYGAPELPFLVSPPTLFPPLSGLEHVAISSWTQDLPPFPLSI